MGPNLRNYDIYKTGLSPLPSKRVTTDANSYHPTVFVPAVSKILEKITATQLASFINKYNIIFNSHFRFRKHKSMKDTTASIINYVI
jgi:hypothetical protein